MFSPVERAVLVAGLSALAIVFAVAAVFAAWNRNTVVIVPQLLTIAAAIGVGFHVGKLDVNDN